MDSIFRAGFLIIILLISESLTAYSQCDDIRQDSLFISGLEQLRKDHDLVFDFASDLILCARANKNHDRYGKALYLFGRLYNEMGQTKEARQYYDSALVFFRKAGNSEYLANTHQSLGNLYDDLGDNKKCMENYIKASEIFEKTQNEEGIANTSNNIGLTYAQMGEFKKSLGYFIKSYESHKKLGNQYGMGNTSNNIGLVYANTGIADTAEYWLKVAMEHWKTIEDLRGQAMTLNGLGRLMLQIENTNSAIEYYKKSIEICETLNDNYGLCQNLISLGELYDVSGYYSTALQYYFDALKLSESMENVRKQAAIHERLSNLYYNIGEYKKTADALRTYNMLKDSIIRDENREIIADMREKYESEKKEKELLQKDFEITQKEQENEKERNFRNVLLGGLSALAILIALIYRSYRIKRKSNHIITEKNKLLEHANQEISAQRDEIEAQRDLVVNQRDLILEQKKDITDSIEYAFKIQSAIFPDPDDIRIILKDFFIFYKPRDIVSGDFYWINKKDKQIIIIAADCTGHGVPGAFMSMLGIAYLNEIVNKENITSPDKILNRLRENIIIALKQHGLTAEQKDGMDIVAISINTETLNLSFAGANNPLYLIKNKEFMEIKGDKMPVSIHYNMVPFNLHTIEIAKNDILYLFSDGFPDQFGGPNGKKFKYKSFKELLKNISNEPMYEQKRIMEHTFNKWLRSDDYKYEQIDDVLVMGVKI